MKKKIDMITASIVAAIIVLLGAAAGIIAKTSDGHIAPQYVKMGIVCGCVVAVFWIIYVIVNNMHTSTSTQ